MQLFNGQPVQHAIQESIVFQDLEKPSDLIWSLLLFTGYLTHTSCHFSKGKKQCNLIIPNQEIASLYEELITDIFKESMPGAEAQALLSAIVKGDTEIFSNLLQSFVLNSMSMFDVPDSEPERSYHLFVLGMLVMLRDQYEVTSNREEGLGRYDIAVVPNASDKPGIVIEFKKVWTENESLETAAQKALDQIVQKKYAASMLSKNLPSVIAYGIAFKGKNILVKSLMLSKN